MKCRKGLIYVSTGLNILLIIVCLYLIVYKADRTKISGGGRENR